jgi:type IV pilus assembly protein PilP
MIRVEQVTVKMNKQIRVCINAVLIVIVCSLFACGNDQPPAPQPQAVSKKINVAEQPKSVPAPAKPKAAAAQVAASAQPAEKPAQAPPASPTDAQPEVSELVKASMEITRVYDPEGRIDPFEPLFKAQPQALDEDVPADKRKRRVPQTPLERVALSQIKLSAIMRSSAGNRALVEDASGKGYVIKLGTYIGLNAGQVIQIEKDRVIIEEEIENLMGELVVQNTELKLQKPAGEL